MYSSVVHMVSLRRRCPRSTWLLLWTVLVNLLCVCQSQNELLLRTIAYPYPLSFNIQDMNGSSMTDVTSPHEGNFYRTLTLHGGKLFVGGKSQLFSVTTEDLSLIENVTGLNAEDYVTVIQPIGDNLVVCGTSSLGIFKRPYCQQRLSQNMSDNGNQFEESSGGYFTAVTHDQNTSWLLVNQTNGLNYHIYVGSELDVGKPFLAKADLDVSEDLLGLNIKENLESINDETFLDEPQFLGDPIDYNGRIYFFFREYATEHINGGKIVFSRVARVCKDDIGGPQHTDFDGKFLTFAKARLSCSVAGTYPFYYNDIQDIYQSTKDVVYAIFTTERGIEGSALCAYRLDELEKLFFDSLYRAPRNGEKANLWFPLPAADEPFPRQTSCPSAATLSSLEPDQHRQIQALTVLLNDEATNKLHYDSSGTTASNPLLISAEERFSQIVVDSTNSTDVFYIGTENGTVLKAYLNGSRSEALVVEEISLNTDGVKPVLSMVKSDSDQAVFVGTDSGVFKIPFVHCCDYILRNLSDAGDPYCKEIVTGDWQKDLSSCSGETMFDTITIIRAPSDHTRALNIIDQPVQVYLIAKAPGGRNLRVVGNTNEVDCGDCAPVPYTKFKSVAADGNEYLLVTIDATAANETNNCSCSISVEIDSGVMETRNFTLTADSSDAFNATVTEYNEIAQFDNNVVLYQVRRDEWLTKIGMSLNLTNVGICTVDDINCP